MTLQFLSLFSGIGGFDLGFERVGMRCALQVEIDKPAQSVLRRHFPHTEVIGDVHDVDQHSAKSVDLICGGFPCQDVSVAGDRAGLAGKRSGLWFEFRRILAELKPRWVVIENVPGLLSSNKGRDFATVIQGLVECGYGVCWRMLDAQYFGVAQRRRRVFIVGHLGDGRAAEVLFEREGGTRDSPPSRTPGEGTAATLSSSAPSRRNGGSAPTEGHFVVAGTLSASGAGTARTGNSRSETDMLIPFRMRGFGDYAADEKAGAVKARDGRDATDLIAFHWNASPSAGLSIGDTSPAIKSSANNQPAVAIDVRNLREQPEGISGVLQSKGTGGYSLNYTNPVIEGYRVRRLTPIECERLQGFPDGWTAGQSDTQRYRQLGNAVAVPVAEWLGHRIMAVEQG